MNSDVINKSIDMLVGNMSKDLVEYIERLYKKENISIIVSTMRQHTMENVFNNYARQDFQNKEMIIIINKNDMDINRWLTKSKEYTNIQIYKLDEKITLGECLNFGISKSKFNLIAKFDDDDYYGPKYLSDSIKAFRNIDADVIGKAACFVYFKKSKKLAIRCGKQENKYVEHMDGNTLIFKRKVFDKIKFADIPNGVDVQISKDCKKNGFKIYSINKYHHVYIRSESPETHTWKINDEDLIRKYCKIIKEDVTDFTRYVNI